MRFSKDKKFIFLANPKTGSTSVRKVLDPFSDHQELIDRNLYHDHWTARQYKKVFQDLELDWDSFYKFVNIRNPWDKYVSNFIFSKPDAKGLPFYNSAYDKNTAGFISFKDWVVLHLEVNEYPPQGCFRVDQFAADAQGNLLVDDVFPIEGFTSVDFPKIIERLNLGISNDLPVANTTKRDKNYQNYYDNKTKALVEKFCYMDIEYGKYVF